MAEIKEARVPDIGDYSDVPVIEVLVAVGDTVDKDQGLVTLESDKATLEVPSPFAGVVRELKVKLGDTLSEGSVVALIEASDGAAAPAPAPAKAEAPAAPVKTAETGAKVEPVAASAAPDAPTSAAVSGERIGRMSRDMFQRRPFAPRAGGRYAGGCGRCRHRPGGAARLHAAFRRAAAPCDPLTSHSGG
jgi:pyruvate/2-oxoglutarate dehydrogenase complex dihydrolipoamide acyltransferase (E2) component